MARQPQHNYNKKALEAGYRSGLEEQVGLQLAKAGIAAAYEENRIHFISPARAAKYTPDWILPNGIIIETKGQFKVPDRQKHLHIKTQHPDLDIRFVFSYLNGKISKGSKTTYAMWCEKHGFLYSKHWIPEAWLQEPPNEKRLAAIKEAVK